MKIIHKESIQRWSDSQNGNSVTSFALKKYMEEFSQVTKIQQKFSESGHGQIKEVDNMHSQIGKRLKAMEIFRPLSLIRILPSVNQKRGFTVFHMQQRSMQHMQADLTFCIGTRCRKIHFTLPEVRSCPTSKQCLLSEDEVVQLYQLFKYIPDIDIEFLKCMFHEYKNKPPNTKKKTKQGPKTK